LGTETAALLRPIRLDHSGAALAGVVNCVSELEFSVRTAAADPFFSCEVDAIFTEPSGQEYRIPAFWAGGDRWKARYAPRVVGRHRFRMVVAEGPAKLDEQWSGTLDAEHYRGNNPLLNHGPVHLSDNRRYFAHADGTPFFWLADSWWHAMSSRHDVLGRLH
jgi:hypothetical protein